MTLAAATLLGSTVTLASAQVVRVRLVDAESRQPLAGVLVSALTAAGAVGPSVLSSGDGVASVRFAGRAPQRLLVRHIGFAPVTTDPVAIPPDIAQAVDIIVPAQRITLNAVHVLGDAACSNQTASPSAGAEEAWTQVRTALEASTLTRDQRLVTTAGYRIQRQLRIDGTVDYADTTLLGKSGERPFVAPAPAVLERDGYFKQRDDGSEEFYAPDEAVLLSAGFTTHHCVRDVPETRHDSTGTEIAVAFVPRDRDTRGEIKGLIWLDSATSELRRVDFEYVRVPLPAPADSLGGSVEFRHLASGAWIVSRWMLRIPRWRVVDRHGYVLLDGYSEVGGFASVVRDLATPGPNVPRTIAGTVYDSIARRPLRGAHVHLADLDRDATTDSTGAFRFDSVSVGVHTVWADHPTLDTLGLFSLGERVDVAPQVVTNVALAIPSFGTLWRRACGSVTMADSTAGFVFGAVHADSTGAPRAGAVVNIGWHADTARGSSDAGATAMADSTGNYIVCGVPGTRALTISALDGAIATPHVALRLGAARIVHRDLVLSAMATVAEGVADTSNAGGNSAMHTLRVVSPDGKPVVYANVSIGGGTTRITNAKGELPLGAGRVHNATTSVRRIGFTPWFGTIDFPDTASVATITLVQVAQYLGEVRITGQNNPSSPFVQGFYDRWLERQKGLLTATFIGPEEIEFRHPDQITNMLSGVKGVRFVNTCFARGCWVAMATDTPTCPMAIVIDGQEQMPELISDPRAPAVYAVRIDRYISAADVMAIEVYARGANMPISLQVKDDRCGVIAFWTGSRH